MLITMMKIEIKKIAYNINIIENKSILKQNYTDTFILYTL
jgi:hypothetical protein